MPKEPKRPKNLDTRFPTRGRSWVDILSGTTASLPTYSWACHGCKDDAPARFDRIAVVDEARSHAASCAAIHLG
ncbi:hypothetical protein [Streptomyces sp. DW26H14]|uniref:hypothetical protein n=1 Tax=Streptomyces sp. DW26H14 TaxID=3435395 RepID=UPI00403DFCA7